MNIYLQNIYKKFGSQWVIKDLSFEFKSGNRYAITGSNGSGKTTLLRILISKIPYTRGSILYQNHEGKTIKAEDVYKFLSIATTSMQVIEEFTLKEMLHFHFKFKKAVDQLTTEEILNKLQLESESEKLISNFSSGMKQRLKIGLALLTDSSTIVLDEPGANLDKASKEWYQKLLLQYAGARTLIIASNDPEDYAICGETLTMGNFK